MCGSLRHEHFCYRPHDYIELFDKRGNLIISAPWEGFARRETLESTWSKYDYREGYIRANSYTERGANFPVGENQGIRAIVATDPKDREKRNIRIVTRPVTNGENAEATRQGCPTHPRHPEIILIEENE